MKKTICLSTFIASLLFFNIQGLSQDMVIENIEIQDNIFRGNIGLQGIGLSYEKKMDNFISLYSEIGLGGVFGHSSEFGNRWAVSPIISSEGRWYFDYKSRQAKGKKVLFNASDFLGLQGGYIFKPIERESFAYINSGYFLLLNLGMQRTLGRKINFELKFGFGVEYSDEFNSGGTAYNLNIKFGYIFNK